jgi:hypothetical protein
MKIILNCTPAGYWVMELDGLVPGIPLCLEPGCKAGDVAVYVARCNPRAKIGIRSACIGPEVVQAYGDVLWLKDEFNDRAQVQQ